MKIILRSYEPRDEHFFLSTALRGMYYALLKDRRPDAKEFFQARGDEFETLLSDPGTTVRVASDAFDSPWIAGYSISKGPELYWIYVRKDFRRRGIGKLLMNGLPIERVRYLTKIGADISEKKGLKFAQGESDVRLERKEGNSAKDACSALY